MYIPKRKTMISVSEVTKILGPTSPNVSPIIWLTDVPDLQHFFLYKLFSHTYYYMLDNVFFAPHKHE